jgi:UDP-N-acetylmuramoyl-tripeptide--D-alanyl-D-alanine ligase
MIKLVLEEVVAALAGQVRGPLPTLSVTGVSTDSRTVGAGEIFFALVGPRFDGHRFVGQALQGGAVAAVVAASQAAAVAQALANEQYSSAGAPVLIEVDDTLAALGRLAAYHRRQLPMDVIVVVGSNGKTTTKAMIDHLLSVRLRGHCSPKSYNNAIGVPLTLLSAETADDYLVVEVGTNAPGEVAALAALVEPDMAVVTCLGEEHLEGLGDLAGVVKEECSIFDHLRAGGFAAVNIDTPQVRDYLPSTDAPSGKGLQRRDLTFATFGRHPDADVRVTSTEYEPPWLDFTLNDRFQYRLRTPGPYNALNAAGAVTIARRLGFEQQEIAARLQSFTPPPMRAEVLELGGVMVLNDAYNANPHSALAAIDMLESLPCRGRRIVVFGEMRELGSKSARLHRKVAERLAVGRIDHVLLVGPAADLMAEALDCAGRLFGPTTQCCETVDAGLEALLGLVQDGDVVLLKASRAVELDRIVQPLGAALGGPAATPAV